MMVRGGGKTLPVRRGQRGGEGGAVTITMLYRRRVDAKRTKKTGKRVEAFASKPTDFLLSNV